MVEPEAEVDQAWAVASLPSFPYRAPVAGKPRFFDANRWSTATTSTSPISSQPGKTRMSPGIARRMPPAFADAEHSATCTTSCSAPSASRCRFSGTAPAGLARYGRRCVPPARRCRPRHRAIGRAARAAPGGWWPGCTGSARSTAPATGSPPPAGRALCRCLACRNVEAKSGDSKRHHRYDVTNHG